MAQDTILLCAGPPVIQGLGNSFTVSNSMIPVNGKPVLGRILDDLLEKGITSVIVVHQATDFQLSDFIYISYADRMKIKQVPVLSDGNIIDSLIRGVEASETNELRIILGDTLIKDSYDLPHKDYVYIHPVRNSSRWCLAHTDKEGYIQNFSDKKPRVQGDLNAVCGYYYFSDSSLLKKVLGRQRQKQKSELSDVLFEYNVTNKIKTVKTDNWFDFGNIDTFFTSKAKLLTGRYFNSLVVNPVLNTITKVSQWDQKLKNELEWYLKIPEELKVLTPRIITKQVHEEKVTIIQEYYGYPTLAEIFLYYNLNPDVWSFILWNLFQIHEKIKSYKGYLPEESIRSIYINKTEERLHMLYKDEYWNEILNKDEIIVNGKNLQNLGYFKEELTLMCEQLVDNCEVAILHGDYCFSNILFDLNSQITRIIDPRGSFGEAGIYGDPRYDVAKLRHSVCGLYDFITSDLFDLEEASPGDYKLKIYKNDSIPEIGKEFDLIIQEKGYNLTEIKFIESLLFLSMIPLHKEKPLRQRAMYIRGISLLNEIFTTHPYLYENSH